MSEFVARVDNNVFRLLLPITVKKLNAEIDVVSQMRDSACLQISTTDNIMAENLLKVQEFRKLNEGLKNGISAVRSFVSLIHDIDSLSITLCLAKCQNRK